MGLTCSALLNSKLDVRNVLNRTQLTDSITKKQNVQDVGVRATTSSSNLSKMDFLSRQRLSSEHNRPLSLLP